jgi:plasmid stabilization system protein ParE
MPEALVNFANVCAYLELEWSDREVASFVRKANRLIRQLAEGNVSFQRSETARCNRVPITPHNMLYYRVVADRLEILSIWDTRQNPSDNPMERL